METYQRALLIIASVRNELALGTKHYVEGHLTTNVREIIEGIRDGTLIIEPTPDRRDLFEEDS